MSGEILVNLYHPDESDDICGLLGGRSPSTVPHFDPESVGASRSRRMRLPARTALFSGRR